MDRTWTVVGDREGGSPTRGSSGGSDQVRSDAMALINSHEQTA